jgi:hypothetical protein
LRLEKLAKLNARDNRSHLCITQDVRNLGAGQTEINRYRDQTHPRKRYIDFHPLDTVVRQYCDAIAGV